MAPSKELRRNEQFSKADVSETSSTSSPILHKADPKVRYCTTLLTQRTLRKAREKWLSVLPVSSVQTLDLPIFRWENCL